MAQGLGFRPLTLRSSPGSSRERERERERDVYSYVYIYIYIYIHIYIYIYIYLSIYIYIYIHTYVHEYIYACLFMYVLFSYMLIAACNHCQEARGGRVHGEGPQRPLTVCSPLRSAFAYSYYHTKHTHDNCKYCL